MNKAFKRSNDMKSTGLRKRLVILTLGLAIAVTCAGCSEKIYSDPNMTSSQGVQTTADPFSFPVLDSKIREYTFALNEFMKDHSDEVTQKVVSGTTVNGVAANCKYTISNDGKYEALQMEKKIEGAMQMDEYFNMGDDFFIARTTIYDNGEYDPVYKYYICGGEIYRISTESDTAEKVGEFSDSSREIANELDIYLSFDEIKAIYG